MLLKKVSEICDELQVFWGVPGKRSRSACFHGWALALRAPVGSHASSECHKRKRQKENWLFILFEKPHPGRSGRQRLRRRAARRAFRRRCARPGLRKPCRPARTAPRAPAWPSCRRAARCAAAPAPDLARWGAPRENESQQEVLMFWSQMRSTADCVAAQRCSPWPSAHCPSKRGRFWHIVHTRRIIQHLDCHFARLQYSWQRLTTRWGAVLLVRCFTGGQ